MAQRLRVGRGAAVLVAVVLLIAAAVVALVVVRRGSGGISGAAKDAKVRIPVGGGVSLSAELVRPKGNGPFPLVLLPTSLGSPLTEYRGFAGPLVRAGYEAVIYVQRGYGGSGGAVDFAAAPTQQDFTRVLDWAVAHEPVDSRRVGAVGRSYGAGVSLLAAARDARVKAVVAMSGWADMAGVFDPNDTASAYALPLLISAAQKTGTLGPIAKQLRAEYASDAGAVGGTVRSMSPDRSPDRVVDQLNAHRTAVLLASGFEDSVLPPASLVSFFDKLTGPKRLQLAPGDHGGPEASGVLGRKNAVTDAALRWLARYVKGDANGVDRQRAVQLTDGATGTVHSYSRWPSGRFDLALGTPGSAGNAGPGAAASWQDDLTGGVDTVASSGPTTVGATAAYDPPQAVLSAVNRRAGAVWTTAPVGQDTLVAGTPRLRVDVSSSSGRATLFAYLYDVDPGGNGSLLSVTPYTVTGAEQARTVSFSLSPLAWTVAAGHRFALVIDTVDHRWQSASTPGTTVHLSSSAKSPATLTVPRPS
jgi:predicted acyl esterase